MHSTSQQPSWPVITLVIALALLPLCVVSHVAAGTPPPRAAAALPTISKSCLSDLISDRAVNDARTLAVRSAPLREPWLNLGRTRGSAVSYLSHTLGREPVRIFGYYCRPSRARARSVPGLLILHGAGGYAVRRRAEEAAARGFAALVIDMPGRGPDRDISRSTGPDLSVENLFRLTPSLRSNYLYNAVYAARRGLTFLHACPEVDPSRLGMYGISWGGVVTLLTTATDPRVQAAVNIFGAGHVAEGSTWVRRLDRMTRADRARWSASFDPANYVGQINCPTLSITGTNDGCYWLPSFTRTQLLMNNASRQLFLPNLNHKINEAGHKALWAWLEGHLKRGQSVPESMRGWRCQIVGEKLQLGCSPGGRRTPRAMTVSYLDSGAGWARAQWRTTRAARGSGQWVANLPVSARPCYVFATATYGDGLALSTPVHTVCAVSYPYGTRLVDAPFMSPGTIHAQAGALAQQMGGRLVDASAGDVAVLAFGAREVHVPARLVAGVSYLALRDVAKAIGAGIVWQRQTVTIALPAPEALVRRTPSATDVAWPSPTTSASPTPRVAPVTEPDPFPRATAETAPLVPVPSPAPRTSTPTVETTPPDAPAAADTRETNARTSQQGGLVRTL